MYKVRFHLANGPNKGHWQVKDLVTGLVKYYNPETTSLSMRRCILVNHHGTAVRIFNGANKTVCAWIEAEIVDVYEGGLFSPIGRLCYNPRRWPYWADHAGRKIDGQGVGRIITCGKGVYSAAVSSKE